MELTHLKIADLDEASVERIRALEGEINAHVLALEPKVTLRELNEAEMEKLRALEDELGVVLLAYEQI